MKYLFLLVALICSCNFVVHAQSPCSDEQVVAFRQLIEICKTFPQNESSLIIGVQIIQAFPTGLAGNTSDFELAFGAIALMYADLINITLHTASPEDVTALDLVGVCTIYNQLSATPLAPFIQIQNLAALLEIIRFGVLNTLTPQPPASNFTEAYYTRNAPGAIRLALVPGGMTVSWQTMSPYRRRPAVRFGTNKRLLFRFRRGDSHTYGTAYFHDVVLKNLRPDTEYFYTIEGDPTRRIYSFVSAPRKYSNKPFVATILGDMGYVNAGETFRALTQVIPKTDVFMHIGDISYADNYFMRPEFAYMDTYEESWNIWQQWMMPITSNVPYMVLPGNHEAACQLFLSYMVCPLNQQNFTAYRHRFRMPSIESGAGDVQSMWSSFDYGLVHFVMINTETDFENAPEGPQSNTVAGPFGGGDKPTQLQWLEADLQKAVNNRHKRPWIVVMGHRPIYTGIIPDPTKGTLDGFNPVVPATFESILAKYKVDIYMAGHLHFYERLFPISGGVPQHYDGNVYSNPTAPTYIINGAAGNDERIEEVVYNHTLGSYYNNRDYGFGKLHVHNRTHLEWRYLRSATREVDDTLWIIQDQYSSIHPPSPSPSPSSSYSAGLEDEDEDVYGGEYENEDDDD